MRCCRVCGRLFPAPAVDLRCPTCGARVRLRDLRSIEQCLAMLLTACICYVPANLLPIMITHQLGADHQSTIAGGVILLWQHGSYPIALIILLASVLVPTLKILALAFLCFAVQRGHTTNPRELTFLYHLTEWVGRWSMVDVFVVALLVALVQLGQLIYIVPGPAALAFCGVVIFTMLAARAFDPRLIWDLEGNKPDREG